MSEPAPPSTGVDICNLALARLGQTERVTSLEAPVGKLANLAALQYPVTRRRLLRGPRIYSFAKAQAQLTEDATVTPLFGFATAFRLPNDCLRVLTLGDINEGDPQLQSRYDIRGRHIFTDETDEDDTLNLTYIKDETLVGMWDALFVNLIKLELANDISGGVVGLKPSVITNLQNELRDVRLEAGAVSGQENPPKVIDRSKWVNGRRLGGGGRDVTRHPI
jgi:hypothetical protein